MSTLRFKLRQVRSRLDSIGGRDRDVMVLYGDDEIGGGPDPAVVASARAAAGSDDLLLLVTYGASVDPA